MHICRKCTKTILSVITPTCCSSLVKLEWSTSFQAAVSLSLYMSCKTRIGIHTNVKAMKFGTLQVAFDDLPINHGKTQKQREEYWDRSRRLQHGTLVALWWETPSLQEAQPQPAINPCITFATISLREKEQLAPRDVTLRPRICIRYTCPQLQ